MRAVTANDFRLHGWGILTTQAGALALLALVFTLRPSNAAQEMALAFNLNLILTSLWGEWLISREKTKGTFAWLRTLPLGDAELVRAKFVTAAIWTVLLWSCSSILLARGHMVTDRLEVWFAALGVLLTFGAFTLACRWRFGQKIGQTLPFAVVLLLLLLFMAADRAGHAARPQMVAWWQSPAGRAGVIVALGATYLLTVRFTELWVRRSETWRLIE